jgi:shikimate 5-dehydrogenase
MDPAMTSPALQEIIALLGCPAAGNPAQYLFERAIEAAELDWRFITFDVAADDVAAAVAALSRDRFAKRACGWLPPRARRPSLPAA